MWVGVGEILGVGARCGTGHTPELVSGFLGLILAE